MRTQLVRNKGKGPLFKSIIILVLEKRVLVNSFSSDQYLVTLFLLLLLCCRVAGISAAHRLLHGVGLCSAQCSSLKPAA